MLPSTSRRKKDRSRSPVSAVAACFSISKCITLTCGIYFIFSRVYGLVWGAPPIAAPVVRSNDDSKPESAQARASYRPVSFTAPQEPEPKDWLKCRAVEESKFRDVRPMGKPGGDRALKVVPPRRGASWTLELTKNSSSGWLGLHRWDSRYQYGSATADKAVADLGYCRIHMPSVPRSGSTWWRLLLEMATGRPSTAMWPESGVWVEHYQAFMSGERCGSDPNRMEGKAAANRPFPCRNLTPPQGSDPIVFKSHTPYWPSFDRPTLMADKTCMLLLLVRNPLDNLDAWNRYAPKQAMNLRSFLPQWAGHLLHWLAAFPDVPVYVFRYEDLMADATGALEDALAVLPGRWAYSDESIAAALRAYGPKEPMEARCGKSMPSYALSEIFMLRNNYAGLLGHFGYRLRETVPPAVTK